MEEETKIWACSECYKDITEQYRGYGGIECQHCDEWVMPALIKSPSKLLDEYNINKRQANKDYKDLITDLKDYMDMQLDYIKKYQKANKK